MSAPGRTDLVLFFKDREVEARLAQTRAHRQPRGTCPDDGNGRSFFQLRSPYSCSLLVEIG